MRERFGRAEQIMRPIAARTARSLGLDQAGAPYTAESALYPGHGCVRVDDYWLIVDFAPGWRAALRLAPHRGQAVIAEVRVYPADEFPGQDAGQWAAEYLGVRAWSRVRGAAKAGITARLLRRVPLGAHLKHAQALLASLGWADLASHGFSSGKRASVRGPRSDRTPDLFYARLARDYAARVSAGSRKPVADVAGRHKMSAAAARDAIHTARERGLLTVGAAGRPGGSLTPAALKILKRGK